MFMNKARLTPPACAVQVLLPVKVHILPAPLEPVWLSQSPEERT